MEELAPLLILGVTGAAWLAHWWRGEQDNRRAILARLLRRVDGGALRSGAVADEVVGTHAGRALRLRLRSRWGSGRARKLTGPLLTRVYPVRVDVDLLHAPAVRLRVRRDQGLAAMEKALGLVRDVEVAGGERFDRDYLVEADGEAASTPLASHAVRQAVEVLLRRWPLDELSIRDGKLVVRGAPDTVGLRELDGLLEALEVLARAYDRRPGDELGLTGRFVWVGGGDVQPRCPYCHDELDDALALVSCGECRTVLHQDCHVENHGCPLLGCGGRRADWARGPTDKQALEAASSGQGAGQGAIDLDLAPEGTLLSEPTASRRAPGGLGEEGPSTPALRDVVGAPLTLVPEDDGPTTPGRPERARERGP